MIKYLKYIPIFFLLALVVTFLTGCSSNTQNYNIDAVQESEEIILGGTDTFGNTSAGSEDIKIILSYEDDPVSQRVAINPVSPASSGSLISMSAYIAYSGTETSYNLKAIVSELDGDSADNHTQIAIKENSGITDYTTHWETFIFDGENISSEKTYLLNIVSDGNSAVSGQEIVIRGENGVDVGPYDLYQTTYTSAPFGYTTPSSPWNQSKLGSYNEEISIYATYTASTPAEDIKKPLPIIQF